MSLFTSAIPYNNLSKDRDLSHFLTLKKASILSIHLYMVVFKALIHFKKGICLFFRQTVSVIGFIACALLFQPASANMCSTYFKSDFSSLDFWDSLSAIHSRYFLSNLKRSVEAYDKARDTSDHMDQLELLGFNFRSARTLRIPPLIEIISKYQSIMKGYQSSHRIDFYFDLVFAFKNEVTGEFLFLKFGETIPPGFLAYEGVLDPDTYFDLISKGQYVLGLPKNKYADGSKFYITIFDHDLAHVTTFIQFPEVMKYLARLAEHRLQESYQKDNSSDDYPYFLPFEAWNYIPQKHHAQFRALVSGLIPEKPGFVSSRDIFFRLIRLSKEDFYSFADKLKLLQHQIVQYAGGTFRDIMTQQYFLQIMYRTNYNAKFDDEMASNKHLSKLIQYQVNRLIYREKLQRDSNLSPINNKHSYYIDLQLVANILALMDALTKISMEDAYASFGETGFKPGSVLEKMYREIELKNPRQYP